MKTSPLITAEEFENLSPNEKRIALAKDVIIRINNENFIEMRGTILDGEVKDQHSLNPKEAINSSECEVCARGALLCSWIGNFNNVSWPELNKLGSFVRYSYSSVGFPEDLLTVFGREMLDNIEAAFECSTFEWHYDEAETQKYVDAFAREKEDEDGDILPIGAPIIELMEWIIKNDGEFPLP